MVNLRRLQAKHTPRVTNNATAPTAAPIVTSTNQVDDEEVESGSGEGVLSGLEMGPGEGASSKLA